MAKSWPEIDEQLKIADANIWQLFDLIWNNATELEKTKLKVRVERYPYGSSILELGVAFAANGKPLPQDFLIDRQTPFGVILNDHVCEVTEWGWGNLGYRPMPQALLKKGDQIGLFELQSYLAEFTATQFSDWSITSGARVVETPLRLNLDTPYDNLRKSQKFQSLSDAWNDARSIGRRIQKAGEKEHPFVPKFEFFKNIAKTGQFGLKKWFVEIVFFSRGWFEAFASLTSQNMASVTALKSRLRIADDAWCRSSNISGRTSSELPHALHKLAIQAYGNKKSLDAARLFYFVERVHAVATGSRPAFGPATSDDLGPFKFFTELLREIKRPPIILVPTLINDSETGVFLSLLYFGLPGAKTGKTQGEKVDLLVTGAKTMLLETLHHLPSADLIKDEIQERIRLMRDQVLFRRLTFEKRKVYYSGLSDDELNQSYENEFFADFDSKLVEDYLQKSGGFFGACAKIRKAD